MEKSERYTGLFYLYLFEKTIFYLTNFEALWVMALSNAQSHLYLSA